MTNKKMGRPPMPPEQRKIRIHISISPELEEAAFKEGYSEFFEKLGQQHLRAKRAIERMKGVS